MAVRKHKFYVRENNSGGYFVALDYSTWVSIESTSADGAIRQFEKHFNLKWNDSNSFDSGGSCSCCGRRFTLYCPEDKASSEIDCFGCVEPYNELPHFVNCYKGGPLSEYPINQKD